MDNPQFTEDRPLIIVIEAEPVARHAHKAFVPKGSKKAIVTKTSDDVFYQNLARTAAAAQCRKQGLQFPLDGYVQIKIDFVRTAPAGLKKDEKAWIERGNWLGDNQKTDYDNLSKNLLDGLEGMAVTNDARIQGVHAINKWIGRKPITYVRLWTAPERPMRVMPELLRNLW